MLFCQINICVWSKSIQMKIRAVITVLLLLFSNVGQQTQPAGTEADCCFASISVASVEFVLARRFFSLSPWTLLGIWVSFFFFPPTPLTSFSLRLFNIFLPQLWLEALCSLYIWLSYFHECHIPQTHGGNFIILATYVPSDSRMNWLEFCGQKLKDGATSQTHYWIHNC